MPTLPSSQRYAFPANGKIYFLPTIASAALVPTTSEVTAGTDLTGEVDDMSGWSTKTNFAETKDASTLFRGQVPISANADDSSLTFNASKNGTDIRATLTEAQSGYIVISPTGAAAVGKKVDVFPIIVGSVTPLHSLSEAEKVRVDFAIPAKPAMNVAMTA